MKNKIIIIGIIILFIFDLTGCFDNSNMGEPPIINYFTATPSLVELHNSSVLEWSIDNATTVSIDNGIGNVSINGQYTVILRKSITYTITAENSYGISNASVHIYTYKNLTNNTDESPPNITFSKSDKTLTVTSVDNNIDWNDFYAIYDNNVIAALTLNGGHSLHSGRDYPIAPNNTYIEVGDYLTVTLQTGETDGQLQIIHSPTNSTIGIWIIDSEHDQ